MVTCLSCGGSYEPVLADGLQYFHRCPPLSAAQLQAAIDAGLVKLPAGETPDVAVTRRVYERAGLRDENLVSTHEKDAGSLKADGAGIVETLVAAPIVVTVAVPAHGADPAPAPLPPAPAAIGTP